MARLAREHQDREQLFAAAIMLASAMMMARVLVIVGIVNAELVALLATPLLLAVLAQAGVAAYLAWRAHGEAAEHPQLALRNPFDLGAVLQFGALLAVITLLAKWLAAWAGAGGAYALALISGLVDVDAISLSMARLVPGSLTEASAAIAILIAVASNSASKLALAATAGTMDLARVLALGLAAALAAGGLGLWVALQLV
jgi:uncharacterized membrane protein (DUF4010 family)